MQEELAETSPKDKKALGNALAVELATHKKGYKNILKKFKVSNAVTQEAITSPS